MDDAGGGGFGERKTNTASQVKFSRRGELGVFGFADKEKTRQSGGQKGFSDYPQGATSSLEGDEVALLVLNYQAH
jgi:hypothetical protein